MKAKNDLVGLDCLHTQDALLCDVVGQPKELTAQMEEEWFKIRSLVLSGVGGKGGVWGADTEQDLKHRQWFQAAAFDLIWACRARLASEDRSDLFRVPMPIDIL